VWRSTRIGGFGAGDRFDGSVGAREDHDEARPAGTASAHRKEHLMPGKALDTLLAYHRAWSGHDMDLAMTYIADDVEVLAPAGPIRGAAAFRGFMEPFSGIVTSYLRVAAFGDDDTAVIVYDTTTVPVPDAPGAEAVKVVDGRIAWMRIVFDRLPFDVARRAS
jgi:hypothetical protein